MPVSAERGQAWCKVNTGRGWLEETKVFYGQCFKSGLTVLGDDLVICALVGQKLCWFPRAQKLVELRSAVQMRTSTPTQFVAIPTY